MEDLNNANDEIISKDITEKGKTVTVIARPICDDFWELSIRGKGSQFTTWTEWFASPEEAISEGLSAILKEGLQEFYSNPDFEYGF